MHCVWRSFFPLLHEHLVRRRYYCLGTVLGFLVEDDEIFLMKETRWVECIYDLTSGAYHVSPGGCFSVVKWPKASAFDSVQYSRSRA